MRPIILITILIIIEYGPSMAQGNYLGVLKEVKQNNQSIRKYDQYAKSRIIEARTNLNPSNPAFEMDYLWGSEPNTYLNEIGVMQEFDFPTVYKHRNEIAKIEEEKYNYGKMNSTWKILSDTRLLLVGLVYLYKLEEEYEKRLNMAEELLDDQKKRLEEGYANNLEVEKALLHKNLINSDLLEVRSRTEIKQDHLRELNGGTPISFESTNYPIFPPLPPLDTLFQKIEAVDPLNIIIRKGIEQAQSNVRLKKAEGLPEFEAGYRYERDFLNKFNGVHFGVSIPLWENKNKVKYSKARVDYLQSEIVEHETQHYYKIKETYQSLISVQDRLKKLSKVVSELEYEKNLNKALQEGEISSIDFYTEYVYLFSITDRYLETQRDYYLLQTELFKFELLDMVN